MPVVLTVLLLVAPPILLGKREARMAESKAVFVGTVLEVDTCAHMFSGFANVYQNVRYQVDDVLKGTLPRQVTVAHYIQQGNTPLTEDACLDPTVFGIGSHVLVFTEWRNRFTQPPPAEPAGRRNVSWPREGAEVGEWAVSARSTSALELLGALSRPLPQVVVSAAEVRGTSVHVLFSDGSGAVLQGEFFRGWVGLDPVFELPVISPDKRSVLIQATGTFMEFVSVVLTWTPSMETFPRAWSAVQAVSLGRAGGAKARWVDAHTIAFEGLDPALSLRADLTSGTVWEQPD